MAPIRAGCIPFSGSSMQIRPETSGSISRVHSARKRRVPSESARAGRKPPVARRASNVSSSRRSSRSIRTSLTSVRVDARAASFAKTDSELPPVALARCPSRYIAAARWAPSAAKIPGASNGSGDRIAVGSSASVRQLWNSRRAARIVGSADVAVVLIIVRGAVSAGEGRGCPLLPPS